MSPGLRDLIDGLAAQPRKCAYDLGFALADMDPEEARELRNALCESEDPYVLMLVEVMDGHAQGLRGRRTDRDVGPTRAE